MPVSSIFCNLAQSQDTSMKHGNCRLLDSYRCGVRIFIFLCYRKCAHDDCSGKAFWL